MAKRAVRADTQHLGIRRLKVANAPVEGGHARASAGRPVERIEEDDHVLAAELSQADFPEPDGAEREVRRGIADIEGSVVAHSPNPPSAKFRATRSLILTRTSAARARA